MGGANGISGCCTIQTSSRASSFWAILTSARETAVFLGGLATSTSFRAPRNNLKLNPALVKRFLAPCNQRFALPSSRRQSLSTKSHEETRRIENLRAFFVWLRG